MVRIFVWGVTSVCVSVLVYTLRIVSRDKILRFKKTFTVVIIIY